MGLKIGWSHTSSVFIVLSCLACRSHPIRERPSERELNLNNFIAGSCTCPTARDRALFLSTGTRKAQKAAHYVCFMDFKRTLFLFIGRLLELK